MKRIAKKVLLLVVCSLYVLPVHTTSMKKGWQVVKNKTKVLTGKAERKLKEGIKKQKRAIIYNPHKDQVAKVRIGNKLPKEESIYRKKRFAKVRVGLEHFTGRSIGKKDAVPTVAIVASGGGYRAMTSTLGFLLGAEKIGLLDTVMYQVGLSGSTWAIGGWMARSTSLSAFKKLLIPKMKKKLENINVHESTLLTNALLVKYAFGQPMTLVDLYGTLLANRLFDDFGDERQRVYLSAQTDRIKDASVPFPIYTAVDGREGVSGAPEWYEFTPYEIGSAWLGMYIPTWAYGRRFEKGKSVDSAPEQSFGFCLGTFGSAFAATVDKLYLRVADKVANIKLRKLFDTAVAQVGNKRLTRARVFNFTQGMKKSRIADNAHIQLVDVAFGINLPYPPISGERPQRKADVIIFLDMSKKVKEKGGAPGLRKVEAYARRKNLKFPRINYEGIADRTISIFKEDDPEVPIVVYMPRINDAQLREQYAQDPAAADYLASIDDFDVEACVYSGYCGTLNLKYAAEQALQLSALAEFNVWANKKSFVAVLQEAIQRKKGKKKRSLFAMRKSGFCLGFDTQTTPLLLTKRVGLLGTWHGESMNAYMTE